jgi:hypothetical protein
MDDDSAGGLAGKTADEIIGAAGSLAAATGFTGEDVEFVAGAAETTPGGTAGRIRLVALSIFVAVWAGFDTGAGGTTTGTAGRIEELGASVFEAAGAGSFALTVGGV